MLAWWNAPHGNNHRGCYTCSHYVLVKAMIGKETKTMRSLSKSTIAVTRLLLVIIIPILSIWNVKPVVLAQAQPHPFKEIRILYTAEFGAPNPTGFTFLPQSSGFILWGAQSNTQEIQLVSNYEHPSGSLVLPVTVEDPLVAAFDAHSNS